MWPASPGTVACGARNISPAENPNGATPRALREEAGPGSGRRHWAARLRHGPVLGVAALLQCEACGAAKAGAGYSVVLSTIGYSSHQLANRHSVSGLHERASHAVVPHQRQRPFAARSHQPTERCLCH